MTGTYRTTVTLSRIFFLFFRDGDRGARGAIGVAALAFALNKAPQGSEIVLALSPWDVPYRPGAVATFLPACRGP